MSSQQLIQESIDQALANNTGPQVVGPGSSLGLDAAGSYWQPTQTASVSDGSFAHAEANRMNTLRNLTATASYTPECSITGPC